MIENFKAFLFALLIPLLAFFEPINNLILAVAVLYLINIITGVIEDVRNKSAPPNFRKFIFSMAELLVYMLFMLTVFGIAKLLEDGDGGKYVAKVITYIAIYFYGQNIIKNMRKIWPRNQFLQLMEYLLNVKFVNEKLPFYRDFLSWKKKATNEE